MLYPGGHGPLWDLAEDPQLTSLIGTMYVAGKLVAAVCHAPDVLCHTKAPGGSPFVRDKPIIGFTSSEEAVVGLTEVVPLLVGDMLKKNGGKYSKGSNWQSYVIVAASLTTGQNPASSEAAVKALLSRLSMA